jgi:hypothetical protein
VVLIDETRVEHWRIIRIDRAEEAGIHHPSNRMPSSLLHDAQAVIARRADFQGCLPFLQHGNKIGIVKAADAVANSFGSQQVDGVSAAARTDNTTALTIAEP